VQAFSHPGRGQTVTPTSRVKGQSGPALKSASVATAQVDNAPPPRELATRRTPRLRHTLPRPPRAGTSTVLVCACSNRRRRRLPG